MAKIICASSCVALASCGSLRTTYLANGSRGYAITCRGFLNTWDSCLVQAGQKCGSAGYEIIESDKYSRTLLVGCKVPGKADLTAR